MSFDFFTPTNIPPEFEAYFTGQREVGRSGKVGILRLKLERDPYTGKTIIREQYSRVPLFAQRAMYLEETLPIMAYLYIVSPSGGILQGDRYRIDITLDNNAFAHVTTQGATRIYKMEKNYASQIINIKVGDGSYFEYIPDQIIPFRNSRFYQEVELNVHDNATLIYSETIVPGRVASGEAFEYDICYLRTVGRNQSGKTRFMDTVKLEPRNENLRDEWILGNFQIVGTTYVVTRESYIDALQYEISDKIKGFEVKGNISGATSILPARQGIVVRIVGNSSEDMKKIIFEVVRIARKQIIGASFSGIRKS
ncbi:MAG: urease accessory protein UreD [Nitrososphaeraceae archaeon]|nr:urease accessory protein UreD [Nitrososphaeraceae archaeon]